MTYTYSTSTSQEALLSWIVKQWNAERDTNLTNAQYVQERISALFTPFVVPYKESVRTNVTQAFEAAPPALQQQVKDLLKVSL